MFRTEPKKTLQKFITFVGKVKYVSLFLPKLLKNYLTLRSSSQEVV